MKSEFCVLKKVRESSRLCRERGTTLSREDEDWREAEQLFHGEIRGNRHSFQLQPSQLLQHNHKVWNLALLLLATTTSREEVVSPPPARTIHNLLKMSILSLGIRRWCQAASANAFTTASATLHIFLPTSLASSLSLSLYCCSHAELDVFFTR